MANNSNNNNNNTKMSLAKISFYMIITVAVLYVISMILSLVNINLKVVSALQGLATAIMITIVGILAFRYVRYRTWVWQLLYVLSFILVIVGIIVPLL